MNLADRRPESNGIDDKYVSRFIVRSLRFAIRRGLDLDQWFARLPKNLQRNFYYEGVRRAIFRAE